MSPEDAGIAELRFAAMTEGFIAFRGGPELHDGKIVKVEQDGDTARVVVEAETGRELEVVFYGVTSLTQHRAEGMTLYALSEMDYEAPQRHFLFANWDDEDDAQLEVIARDFDFRERS
jgi:hypothetical protein